LQARTLRPASISRTRTATLERRCNSTRNAALTTRVATTAAAGNPAIRLYEVNTNNPQPITSFEGHTNNVTAVGFERDGRWMYSGSEDGTVKIWDLRASGFQREYESRGAVNSVVLHPNQVRTRRDACANHAAVRAASVCLSASVLAPARVSLCGLMRTYYRPSLKVSPSRQAYAERLRYYS
jgi:hypothetical protein